MKKLLCFLLLQVLFITGCSTSFKAYDKQASSTGSLLKNAAGLEIMVDPVLEADRQKAYFGYSLEKNLILPVFIRVKNTSGGQSFLLQRAGMALNLPGANGGPAQTTGSVAKDTTGGQVLGIVGVVSTIASPVAAPLMVVGPLMEGRDHQMTQNLVDKQYYDNTVSPGATAEGFVYFQLPKKTHDVSSFTINFTAKELQSEKEIHISYEHK